MEKFPQKWDYSHKNGLVPIKKGSSCKNGNVSGHTSTCTAPEQPGALILALVLRSNAIFIKISSNSHKNGKNSIKRGTSHLLLDTLPLTREQAFFNFS
jgi:hypothetical protein